MGEISYALALVEAGDYDDALDVLMQELENSKDKPESEMLLEWIALCYAKIGDFIEAAKWYESAALMVLVSDTPPLNRRSADALYFLKSASEFYERAGLDPAQRLEPVIRRLSKLVPSV